MKKVWMNTFEIITLAALVCAPLSLLTISTELLFPYITSKNFVWRVLVEIALVSWASLALIDSRYRIAWRNPVFVSFSLFMLVILVANLNGFDPYNSFWSTVERMDGYVGLLHLYAFFIAGLGFLQTQNKISPRLPNLIWGGGLLIALVSNYHATLLFMASEQAILVICGSTLIGGSLILLSRADSSIYHRLVHSLMALGVILGFFALFQDKARVDSVLGNPIYLASYSSFSAFISMYFAVVGKPLYKRVYLRPIIYGTLALFFVYIIAQSGTRGAVLGLLFGGLATAVSVVFFAREARYTWYRRAAWLGLFVAGLAIFSFFSFQQTLQPLAQEYLGSDHIATRALHFSLDDTTTKHRLANWEIALEGAAQRPLLGWGQENYIRVFSKNYQADKLYDAEQWFDRTHNMFLDWLVFGGIFGLLSFMAFLGSMLYLLWRHGEQYFGRLGQCIFTGALFAYVAQNFVAFDSLATGIWMSAIAVTIALLHPTPQQSSNCTHTTPMWIGVVALWTSLVVCLWVSVWTPRTELVHFTQLLRSPTLAPAEQNLFLQTYLPKLETSLNNISMFDSVFIEQLLLRPGVYLNANTNPKTQQAYLSLVTQQAEAFIADHPNNTRVPLWYGQLLYKTGHHDKALVYLQKALSNSPHKVYILQMIAQVYTTQNAPAQAILYLKRAQTLAPSYTELQTHIEQLQ